MQHENNLAKALYEQRYGPADRRLRDEFAAKAMQGIISSMVSGDEYQRLKAVATQCGLTLSQWIARDAYKQADAMMAARNAVSTDDVCTKHIFWGAGEPDCPKDIKSSNGELHTLRCKICGKNAT